MKNFLLCLALLLGLRDGSIVFFGGYPLIMVSATEIVVDSIAFPIETIERIRYVPDNLVI